VVFWFRHDLRLHDNPALTHAVQLAREHRTWLLPVVVIDPAQTTALTRWGFARQGPHRAQFVAEGVAALAQALHALGTPLWVWHADPVTTLTACMQQLQASALVCEDIPAPEEQATVAAIRAKANATTSASGTGVQAGVARAVCEVHAVWQSTLYAPEALPMPPHQVPDTFTAFRRQLEASGATEATPLPAITAWPKVPGHDFIHPTLAAAQAPLAAHAPDPLASLRPSPVPTQAHAPDTASAPTVAGHGGEAAALAHLARYCAQGLPHTYKATRNALTGFDHSSRWSPWLASGALSARQAMAAIRQFEAEHGATDSTYWLWFELLWRDHFRWMHAKHGAALYLARGLGPSLSHAPTPTPPPTHNAQGFARWCSGHTSQPLVDAGMRELATTGWLSNRMRQIVASYLVHDLGGDWRAGAAWFEHTLIDFDPCSNQGNWAYIAGRGTDPRGGRRFNTEKQSQDHDPDGHYRRLWCTA
jgi:deoxyribodipyrimidine photo-lyase